MTLEETKQLTYRQVLHEAHGPGREPVRWRVNGAVKVWKRSPGRVQVPIKHRMRDFGYITESNCNEFHLEQKCVMEGGSNDARY